MNKINYLLLLTFLIPISLFAQTTQVHGVIRDSASGNPLSSVSVELRSAKGKVAGATTNKNGEYNSWPSWKQYLWRTASKPLI